MPEILVPRWSVVVPAKRLSLAKTRLRPLSDTVVGALVDHREWVLAFLGDTVSAVIASNAVKHVLVVTNDGEAAEVARDCGGNAIPDVPNRGLNAALRYGARASESRHVAALSGDLPSLRATELADALTQALQAPRCFVTDSVGTGTTMLTACYTRLLPAFGPDSARIHRRRGARALTGHWPGLALDVDTPYDLRQAVALGVGPRTNVLVERVRGWLC